MPWLGQMKLSVSCLEQVKTPSASEIWITFFSSIFHCRKFGNPINVKEIKAELFLINLWKMLLSLLSFSFIFSISYRSGQGSKVIYVHDQFVEVQTGTLLTFVTILEKHHR